VTAKGGHVQASALEILKSRRFLPLFITQFLGALNDNILKNAMVILVTFGMAREAGASTNMIVVFAGGCFIVPFFLFSATAGRLADKFEKSRLIVIIKASEVAIMCLAVSGFLSASLPLLLVSLFLMGTHSSFFGPLKYGILPSHLRESELLTGNALIETGTFLAILIGTIAGGLLIAAERGTIMVSALLTLVAGAGLLASLFIPHAQAAAPQLKLGFNIIAHTSEMVREAAARRSIRLAIMGISWFWLVGATFLSQFPAFAKEVLGAGNQVVTLFLTAFSLGIGIGSMLCSRLLKGEISARYVPLGALGITVFAIDLYFASRNLTPAVGATVGVKEFLSSFAGWRIFVDLLLLSVSSGLYIVPLYTILQSRSEPERRSRVIASNNILNALFMTIGAISTMGLLALAWTIPQIFLTIAIINLLVAIYIYRL
jgi:acyl-[acyl-carrier-protein]-phospholipid O-acyltransferase/long-chain-fatty-acid--[acyl-carrier-protein] ligase